MTRPDMDAVTTPADLKALDEGELENLCRHLRRTLVAYGHAHGGHIGSNLAMVEATVALHRVFDSPHDAIIFDVSHQCYVHKMLTGRAWAYADPARFDDVSGFTNPDESVHDRFTLGHTGTAVSLACGLAKARDMQVAAHRSAPIGNVIAVLGDGSLSSGVAFEGLNNAAAQGGNLIIVLNDNEMSIAGNVGGMYGTLARLRRMGGEGEPNLFHALGLDYRYVENGNDVHALVDAFTQVRGIGHPVVVHIHTRKGLGLDELDAREGAVAGRCEANHWRDPLASCARPLPAREHYGRLAMQWLATRWHDDPGLTVICPATPRSNGITEEFRRTAGTHYVDTGITEQHAVAFASGLAQSGGTPVLATSATFFQRAYDQLRQELALNRQPVTLLVFAGGLSAADNTHSGAGDIAMFSTIPGLTYLVPGSGPELLNMLRWSTTERRHGAIAIRIPSQAVLDEERSLGNGDADSHDAGTRTTPGSAPAPPTSPAFVASISNASHMDGAASPNLVDGHGSPTPFDGYLTEQEGGDIALLAMGNTMPLARRAAHLLSGPPEHPVTATVLRARQCTRLDTTTLCALAARHRLLVTIEDGQRDGGWGQSVAAWMSGHPAPAIHTMRTIVLGGDRECTDRTPLQALHHRYGMDPEAIARRIRAALARHDSA